MKQEVNLIRARLKTPRAAAILFFPLFALMWSGFRAATSRGQSGF
jgi:hypothetical protein